MVGKKDLYFYSLTTDDFRQVLWKDTLISLQIKNYDVSQLQEDRLSWETSFFHTDTHELQKEQSHSKITTKTICLATKNYLKR